MIDLERNLQNHEKRVKDYILDRVNTYFSSDCHSKLKTRVKRLNDSIDMRFHQVRSGVRAVNQWKSKIAMPLVRESFLARRAVTKSAFRQEPLVTVEATNDTPTENASNVQDVLTQNWKSTRFKATTLNRVINACSRWGSAVVVYGFQRSQERYRTTTRTPWGYDRLWQVRPRNNCVNTPVHPLNYFQDPMVPNPCNARYRGYIERIPLSQLIRELKAEPDAFIGRNVKMAITEAKKHFERNRHYYDNTNAPKETDAIGVDRVHYYGEVTINGNEDSTSRYYAQLIGDHIIRFEENQNDEGLEPIETFHFDQRLNYWWGNVDTESVLPHENFMQLIMSMAADEGLRNLERFIFYDAGSIDPADLNNRHKSGGFIPYDGKGKPARELFHEYQGSNTNALNGLQYLMAEMKESAQRVRPKSDMMRQGLQGGPRNETATAAMMLDEQGDLLESDLLESFSYGLIELAGGNLIVLRQHLPAAFQVRPEARYSPRVVEKMGILGTYDYKYDSALTKNKQIQAQNLLNWLTFLQNMRGTGDPSWLNVNMPAIVRSLFRKIDIGISDDEAYPPMQQAVQNPRVPGMADNSPSASPPPATTPEAATPTLGMSQPQGVPVG